MTDRASRPLLPALAPYLALSAAHLVLLHTGPGWAITATKALLIPALAGAVLVASRRSGAREREVSAGADVSDVSGVVDVSEAPEVSDVSGAVEVSDAAGAGVAGPAAAADAVHEASAPAAVGRRTGSTRPPRGTLGLLIAALAASWAGDVILSVPGGFVPGLLAFLLAHIFYVVLFVRWSRGEPLARRVPVWTLGYVVWYAGFLALLAPHLGALLPPVAVYGFVLGAMAALAAGRGRLVAVGGALFVVSDSVLALGRFLPEYSFALHDLTVMSTYLAAQGLIAVGVVLALRGARPSGPNRPHRPGGLANARRVTSGVEGI